MKGTWQTTDSGGGLVLAVIIAAAVLVGSGAASAIASALEVLVIVAGCTIMLAVLGGITWLIWRARQASPGRPIAARPVYQLPPNRGPSCRHPTNRPSSRPRELHLHLHGLTPEQIAAIVTQRGVYHRGGQLITAIVIIAAVVYLAFRVGHSHANYRHGRVHGPPRRESLLVQSAAHG